MGSFRNFGGIRMGSAVPSGTVTARIDRDLAKLLNHLVHLGRDLAAASAAAIRRVTNKELRMRLAAHDLAHGSRIEEFSDCVGALGHEAAKHGDLRSMLERGRVILGTRNGDKGILQAMAANEETMRAAYRDALAFPNLPVEFAVILKKALAQEERHLAFYDQILERFIG